MAIANIPLNQVIDWLVFYTNRLIEFVPKNDLTVIKMLELKGDIFPNYTIQNFENKLSIKTQILSKTKVSELAEQYMNIKDNLLFFFVYFWFLFLSLI